MALDTNLSPKFCASGGRLEMCHMWQGTSPEQLDPGAQFVAERTEQEADSSVDEQSEKIRALEEELDVLRREQSKLHRGIFEAAQIQRRLCAPRHLDSGEYEVAGEIFPVRHLSGDFFKVMELDSALGIVVGDIAGKGLSAGIWRPHIDALIHPDAGAYLNPALANSQRNTEPGCEYTARTQ